ncbi:MAG: VOC family protein [Kangiellaceae bacterium]|nr:VOC family protein [Kangiellaceae bacterium]MCW8998576.1 VOC family protein [Kangiellaceae bacterium]MCW9015690.1 VOC family protein [Kangiellaceae bacterium]
MSAHHKINYIEFPVQNIENTKAFFAKIFDWEFTDYGEDYCAINNASIDAGFYHSDLTMSSANGSALIVLYSDNLETTQNQVEQAGGKTIKPIFAFPGGRRFHFSDPNNNEFAVWSDK